LDLNGYDDWRVVDETRHLGLCGNSCPIEESLLTMNGHRWVEHESVGIKQLEDGERGGAWHFSTHIPFIPYHSNPMFVVEQKDKLRPILNKTGGPPGKSLNYQAGENERAKMKLINMDQLCRGIAVLQSKVMKMRAVGWNVGLTLSWVDLFNAYCQTGVDPREEWMNGGGYVKVHGDGRREYRYGFTTQSQFGGECTPFSFSRVTRATTFSCERGLRGASDYSLQERWRVLLKKSGTSHTPVDFIPRQIAGRKLAWSERMQYEKELRTRVEKTATRAWNNLEEENALTPGDTLRALSVSSSVIEEGDLFSLGTYIDDCLAMTVQSLDEVNEIGNANPVIEHGEALRVKYIRKPLENCGIVVVGNERSQRKFELGACMRRQVALGFAFDFTDPECPRVGLRKEKVEEYGEMTKALYEKGKTSKMLPFKEVESVAHRLNHACQVIQRGKVYTGGLFASMRSGRDKAWVPVTKWMMRNLQWWIRYFGDGRIPERIIMLPPTLAPKDCPYTDASTSWGCGGYWIADGKCYYLVEEWTEKEKVLIEDQEMGINFLELATVLFLLDASGSHFAHSSFTFYCDNEVSVEMLNNSKSRTGKMSLLLELIDSILSKHNINIHFEWLSTTRNKLANRLSRDAFDEFEQIITKTFGACAFIQVDVDANTRDIGAIVREAIDNPALLEAMVDVSQQ
jgi:hypothetical protein